MTSKVTRSHADMPFADIHL